MDATNSYRSLKIRVTKQAQEIEAWQSKMEVMKRESGKALRENSLLHVELIKKDEACDERLRAAAAEQRKLEDQVAELHFWKQQQTERHLELEKNHEGVKAKLNDVITGSYAFSKVPGEDIKARMELSEALRAAVAEGPSAAGAQTRAEALAAAADDRAAALQRRLVESEAEMARMQAEVDAAKGAVAARDGEIRRLNGLLDNAVDADALALKEIAENKDSLIASLSQQAEDLTRRIIELEKAPSSTAPAPAVAGERPVGPAAAGAGASTAAAEAEFRAKHDALASRLAAAEARTEAAEAASEALAAANAQVDALKRELEAVASARDDAEATVARLTNAAAKGSAGAGGNPPRRPRRPPGRKPRPRRRRRRSATRAPTRASPRRTPRAPRRSSAPPRPRRRRGARRTSSWRRCASWSACARLPSSRRSSVGR